MKNPFVPVYLLFVAVAALFLSRYSAQQASQYGPMSLGHPNEQSSYHQWNNSRLADPVTGEIPLGIREAELRFAKTIPVNTSRTLSWDQIGPKNLGGRTRAVAFDVRNENIVIAGGATGGLWKSVDGLNTFYRTTSPEQIQSITSVVQDTRPGHEDTWYAGTGEFYGVTSIAAFSCVFSGNGIFKSTDNGETWTLLTSTMSNTPQTSYVNGDMDFVWRIVTDHTDLTNDVVLAAVYNGVYRSADGGATWTPVLGIDTSVTTTSDYSDIIVTPGGVFYAYLSSDGPDKGVYRSTDGITWTKILPASGWPGTYRRFTMAYNPTNENEVMFLGETPGVGTNSHSLWKYTYLSGGGDAAGGQWENLSSNMPTHSCTGFFSFDFGEFQTQGGYDVFIAYHPTNDSIIFLGGTNIYRSKDGFTTPNNDKWIGGYRCNTADLGDYTYPDHHPDQHGLIFYPSNPNKALSFTDGGLFVSNDITLDSVFWSSKNNGYITSQFYTVAMELGETASNYLVGGAQDNGTWFTNANHIDSLWRWVGRGDGSFAAIPNGTPYYLMSTQQGKIYKVAVDHYGDTSLVTRIDPNKTSTINFINPFILDPNDNRRMYMINNYKLWRFDRVDTIPLTGNRYDTLDRGWNTLSLSVTSTLYGNISCLEMSKASPNSVYYGTTKGRIFKMVNAHTNTSTKVTLNSTLFPANAYVSSISVSPFDSLQILVTLSNYNIRSIFYSNDGGVNFTEIGGNLEEFSDGSGAGPAVYWGEIYPSFPNPTLFVGTSTGLYSTDVINGSSTVWTQEGASTIGNMHVNMIESRTFDGKMAIATHGAGFYTSYMPPVFLGMKENNLYLTGSIYPNPASDAVKIDFVPLANENSILSVYDLKGKMIFETDLGKYPSGRQQSIRLDLSGCGIASSGTYLFSVRNAQYKKTFKLIVRK